MAPLCDNNCNDADGNNTDGCTIDVEEQDAIQGSINHENDRDSCPLTSLVITDEIDHSQQQQSDDARKKVVSTINADDGAATSMVASVIEREEKQRKTLTEQMIHLLFLALEKKTTKDHDSSSRQQQQELIKMILKEEAGTIEFASKVRSDIVVSSNNISIATTTRTVWNKGRPMRLYWMWHKVATEERENTIQHYICKLGVSAEDGVAVRFSPPASLVGALLSAEENENQSTAVCEVSNFEWRLKGSTKHSYVTIDFDDDIEYDTDCRTEDYIVRSSWKLDRVGFSMVMDESMEEGFVATEEELLEARDVYLSGTIVIDSAQLQSTDENDAIRVATTGVPSLELRANSKSTLSLTVLSSGFAASSAEEKRHVGMLLRTLVDSLDQLLAVPKLRLSVKKLEDDDHYHQQQEDEKETSFHENGLGDALKHILRHHCNDDTGHAAAKQRRHQQHLKRLQQQSPQLFTSSKGFGAMILRAS